MNKQLIASIMILGLVGMVVGVAALADGTATVACTVTPGVISVSVNPTSVAYGVMPLNDTKSSPEITATNGVVPADLNIMGADATAAGPATWTLLAAPGSDAYVHAYTTKTDPYPATGDALTNNPTTGWDDLTTGYLDLAENVAGSGTQKFELDMRTPTSSTGSGEYSTTVTVQAVYAY